MSRVYSNLSRFMRIPAGRVNRTVTRRFHRDGGGRSPGRVSSPVRGAERWPVALFWIFSAMLSIATAFAAETWRVKEGVNLNARSGPGTGHAIVETLRSGAVVEELERTGGWSRVRTAEGQIFFVSNRYLVPDTAAAYRKNWSVQPQLGHSFFVESVAFSPDGRAVATGSRDGTARLWDVATGRALRVLKEHSDTVSSVAFSPDGHIVATASWDNTARLWEPATGRVLQVLTGHSGLVTSVTFSSDGRTVATGSRDGTARLWDVATGRKLLVLEHEYVVTSVVFSPDGRIVATSSSEDNGTYLWDTATGQALQTLRQPYGAYSVAFSPDGYTIVTGSWDGTVRLWEEARAWEPRVLEGHSQTVGSVAFSPDGRVVATGSQDGTAKLWDVSTGRELQLLQHASGTVTSVAFSPDGRSVVTGSWDNTARLWDVATGQELRMLGGHSHLIYSVTFSPDGRTFATGSSGNTARLWDTVTGRELLVVGHPHRVHSIAFSPDGRTVATGAANGTAYLWKSSTGQVLQVLTGHSDMINSVAFSPDGRIVATGAEDNTARLWNAESGDQLQVLRVKKSQSGTVEPAREVESVAFSPDGRTLATGSWDGTVRLWDVGTGRELRVMKGHTANVESVAFSPDGKMLASGSGGYLGAEIDYTARLWDAATGRILKVFRGHSNRVSSIDFSPDGRTLATGSWDNTVRLWDAETGRELWVLKGDFDQVHSLAFSPRGGTVATGSGDGTARLWDAATGRETVALSAFTDGSRIVLTPEGFFDASEGGAEHLNLVRGLDVMSIDQVYDALYRPDLVREALAGDPEGKVAAAAAELDLDKVVATGLPPLIVALRALDGETIEGDSATVAVELEVRDGGLGRVEWRVNGTVQGAESRGLGGIVAAEVDTTRLDKRVFLAPGENAVSVVVYNEANLIASESVEIALTSTQATVSKPSLHVLAAGVNDYFDSRLALSYAVSDARALGVALTQAGRGLYEEVNVTYLLDEEVSAQGMAAAFGELSEAVRPHDVFVFFLAGHGKTHQGRYYFLPRDFRYRGEEALKETAISQEQLQRWTAQVPAQKSVLLFDTCESGSLTEEAVTRGLEEKGAIERLARAVGRTILTASTDTAPALEGYRQHGLFTYTLLEAFAMADHDGDEQVEINELIGYVDDRLPQLSEAAFGFRQVPQFKSQGSVFALGRPVAVLSETEEVIPRTPTHVVVTEAEVFESARDPHSVLETLEPGVRVRVVESADDWSLIAIDGVRLGWVETEELLDFK